MIAVTRVVTTDKPVAEVAAFLSEFTTTETWDPGTVTCRRLTDGPLAVGTRYENTSRFRNNETTLTYRVLEYTPGSHIRLRGENSTVSSTEDMRFEPTGEGAKVTYRAEFRFKRLFRLAEPFLRGALNTLGDHAAAGMKTALADL